MTPQEQQMIDGLISRIRSTTIQDKDNEAEAHIQQSLSGQPDALYSLVQTVLVQQYGLSQAQSQINELKQQIQVLQAQAQETAQNAKTSSGSFLSHIFGGGSQPSQPQPSQTPYQPVNNPGYGSQGYPSGGYPPPSPPVYPSQGYPTGGGGLLGGGGLFGGGGGGFLRGAMQTAAGVAAGEMMFQGMEDLFHGFGGHERGFAGGSGETVVNNYNDDDRQDGRDLGTDDRSGGDCDFYDPSSDASRNDQGDSGQGLADFSSLDCTDVTEGGMDTSSFDGSADDGGFDMGGGDDFSGDNS